MEDKIFILSLLSVILPFYISIPIFIICTLILAWIKRLEVNEFLYHCRYFLAFIIFSASVSLFRHNYIGLAVSFAFLVFLYYFYFYRQWIRGFLLIKIMHYHVIFSGFLSIFAISKYVAYVFQEGYDLLYIFKYNNIQTRAEATFFNANYYGLYCLVICLLIYYLFLKVPVKKWRSIYGILYVLNLIAMLLTGSRWIWPTMIVTLAFFIILLNLRWIIYILPFVIIGAITVLVKPNILPRVESLAYAFSDRIALWTIGYKLFLWHPCLGTGPMTFMSYYYLISDSGNMHAHNLVIDALANFGIVGCLILIGAVIHGLSPLLKNLSNKETKLERVFLLSVLFLVCFHGIMDVAILWFQTGFFILMLVSIPLSTIQQLSKIKIEKENQLFL